MSLSTLLTATPADGQRLARQFTDTLLTSLPTKPATMPEMLRTGANRQIDSDLVTAIYFHAISVANDGWRVTAGLTSSSPS
jgi:hypothetical protein